MIINYVSEPYSETACFIFDCLSTLDKLIGECKSIDNQGAAYDFVDLAENLFCEYIIFRKHFNDEIPLFTKAYARTLNTAYDLISKGVIPKSRFNRLVSYATNIRKLNNNYSKSLKKNVSRIKKLK